MWAESPLSYQGSGTSRGCNRAGSDSGWGRRRLAGEPCSLCGWAQPPPSPSRWAAQHPLCRRARTGSSSPEGLDVLRLHRNVLETVLGWLEGWELKKHSGFSMRVSRPLGETVRLCALAHREHERYFLARRPLGSARRADGMGEGALLSGHPVLGYTVPPARPCHWIV